MTDLQFTVFTKPWNWDIPAIAEHVVALGFDGVELPVRPGYAVNPDNQRAELKNAASVFADFGLTIASVAGNVDESTIAACGEAGVPMIRICVDIGKAETYDEGVARWKRQIDARLPHLEASGVAVGIQNHCDRFVCNAMGLRDFVRDYDPRLVTVVWDAAHNALNGEDPELGLDIVWERLAMVNLKNAYWRRTNNAEDVPATWRPYWTLGREGLASWPRVAAELKQRGFRGPICLTAEYSEHDAVDRLIAEDIKLARQLFAEDGS